MSKVTIRDVAEAAGVSITTVSDILRPVPRWSYRPETVEQVQQAVAQLGYRAHSVARLLRQTQTRLVGIAIDVRTLSLSPLARSIYEELQRRDYEPLLVEARQLIPDSGQTPFPSPGILAGLLSVDMVLEDATPNFYEELRKTVPLIALYPVRSKNIDCVTTNRAAALEIAVEYLVRLGHRHIAFAQNSGLGLPTNEAKRQGWKKALKQHGLPSDAVHELTLPAGEGVKDTIASLADSLPHLQPRPTALICSGDVIALGVMGRLMDDGWSLPDELSVVGYGDNAYCQYSHPSLTVLQEPHGEIARVAVARLIELMENPQDPAILRPRHQLLKPTLIERRSTAAPKVQARPVSKTRVPSRNSKAGSSN